MSVVFLHTWCPQTLLLPHRVYISISNKTFGWYFCSIKLLRWSDSLIVLQWMNWSWNKNRDLKRSAWNEIILYVHQAHHLYNEWKLLYKCYWLLQIICSTNNYALMFVSYAVYRMEPNGRFSKMSLVQIKRIWI